MDNTEQIYTLADFLRYLSMSAAMLSVLAPIAILGWATVLWGVLYLLGIQVRESFSGISWQKTIVVCAFILGSARIMGGVFQRFV